MSLSGMISHAPVSADLNFSASIGKSKLFDLVAGFWGDYEFGKTVLDYQGNAVISENADQFDFSGKLSVKEFTLASEEMDIQPMEPVNIGFDHQISYNKSLDLVKLDRLEMTLRDDATELIGIHLSRPIKLSLTKRADTETQPTDLSVNITAFDLSRLTPLLPRSSEFTIETGMRGDASHNAQFAAYQLSSSRNARCWRLRSRHVSPSNAAWAAHHSGLSSLR